MEPIGNAEDYIKSTGAKLTKYVGGLLHNKVSHTINWEVVANVQPYQCSNACCYLCLNEKLYIATHDCSSLLNKRSELVSKCRHKNKFLLSNFKFNKSLRKAPTWTHCIPYPLSVFSFVTVLCDLPHGFFYLFLPNTILCFRLCTLPEDRFVRETDSCSNNQF